VAALGAGLACLLVIWIIGGLIHIVLFAPVIRRARGTLLWSALVVTSFGWPVIAVSVFGGLLRRRWR
jgi:hypothetical protein